MLNVSGTGRLNKADFKSLLHTMEILPTDDDSAAERGVSLLMSELDTDKDGFLTFEDIRKMMHTQQYFKVNTNRHFVALSLEEAEFVRAVMHSMIPTSSNEVIPAQEAQETKGRSTKRATTVTTSSLFGNADLAFGLRINGRVLLDTTGDYTAPPPQQLASSAQCYRFINSELHYNSTDIGALLRVLHDVPSIKRDTFFNEVRTCRRRVQRDWKDTAVAPAISQQDEYTWLEFHAIISAIKTRIRSRKMRLLDAFRAFDYNRDGVLSCSELYGGLEWLGMKLAPQDIYAVVRHIDTYKDGRIRYLDWEAALKDHTLEEDDESLNTGATEFGNLEILPKQIDELFVDRADIISRTEEIHDSALREIKVKVKDVSAWRQVWSSEGTGARTHVTIWTPHISQHTVFRRNKYRVCLGHYAVVMGQGHSISLRGALHLSKAAKVPSNLKGLTVELTDLDVSTLSKSSNLDEVHVNYLMPHPIGYKMVWWQPSTSDTGNLYVWRPIPPSEDFVALGLVTTTTNQDPALDAIRCVNKGFLVPSTMKPTKLWDNAGTGGKKGSFWIVNSLGLVTVTEGYDPPSQSYEIKSARFIAFDAFALNSKAQNDDSAPPVPQRPPKQLPITPPSSSAPFSVPTPLNAPAPLSAPPPIYTPLRTALPPLTTLPPPLTTLPPLLTTLPPPSTLPSPTSVPPPIYTPPRTAVPLTAPPPLTAPIGPTPTPPRPKASTVSAYDASKPVPITPPPTISPRPPITPPPTTNKPAPPVTPNNPTPLKNLPLQPALVPDTTPTPTSVPPPLLKKSGSSSFIASTTKPGTSTSFKAVPSPFVQANTQPPHPQHPAHGYPPQQPPHRHPPPLQIPAQQPPSRITPPFAPIRPQPAPPGRQLPAKPPP